MRFFKRRKREEKEEEGVEPRHGEETLAVLSGWKVNRRGA